MRRSIGRGAAALLGCFAGAASGQATVDEGGTPPARIHAPTRDEIVVTGRRDSGKYRLAPQFRTAPEAGDHWRRSFARDWSCRDVGPRGCGLQPNPLITLRADGSVQFGDPGSGK
ncbi:MAG: hypothetical protein HOP95_11815 [Sphingomonas sp.]|nr:hypothetical protein [Sphingomonas sp.]